MLKLFKKKPKPIFNLPKDTDFKAFTHERIKEIADISSEIKHAKEFLNCVGSKNEDFTEITFNIRGDKWRISAYRQDDSLQALARSWAKDVARQFIAFKERELQELCKKEDDQL